MTVDSGKTDGLSFREQITKEVQGTLQTALRNPEDAVQAVQGFVSLAAEVRKFEEAQITERTDIAVRRDIALAQIETQKAALLMYLERSFDERRENFQSFFKVVDDALEKDNMQELAMGLDSIMKLAESSPFKDLQSVESTAEALADPEHTWEF